MHNRLITWAHTSPAADHPGTLKTLELLKERYFWLSMAKDINEFVALCSTCAQAKVPRYHPAGKLQLLTNPQRPWSHIAMDFLTDILDSEGNTVIMVVIDRFTRTIHLIPLPTLPNALETATLMFNHVFCNYGHCQ